MIIVGPAGQRDRSETLSASQDGTDASVTDVSLSAPEGTENGASARLRLATQSGETETVLSSVRSVAAEKDLRVIEPLTGGDAA